MQKSGKGVTLEKERCGNVDEDEKVEAKGLQLEHTFCLICVSCFYNCDISPPSIVSLHTVCVCVYIHTHMGLCIIILLWYTNNIVREREEDMYMIYNLSIIL